MNAYPFRYSLFLGLYYTVLAVFQGFVGPFYQDARGMSDTALLWLLVAMPVVAMLAQPLWGRAGDRMPLRNRALYIMGVLGLASILLMCVSHSFLMLLLTTCLFSAFYTPMQPMGDSIILEDLGKRNLPFGPIRLIASLSFAVASLGIGFLFEKRYHLVPYVSAFFMGLLLLSVKVLPPMPGHQRGREKVPMNRLLSLPHMKPLLLMVTALMLALGYFYSYFTLYFTALPGGTAGLAGFSYFISALSEIPYILHSDKLFERYGTGRLMLVAAFLLTVRFFLLAFTRSVPIALFTQVLHGGCFIVITLSMAMYINRVVPDELRSSGQMLLSVVGFAIARIFGIVCGGYISTLGGGPAGGFAAMAVICLVALVAGGLYFLRVPPINGKAQVQ